MAWRVPGEFVPCDVNLANDPAILRAGPMAELLFRRANEYVKRVNRDGVLEAVELPVVALGMTGKPTTYAAALVREGLWEEVENGWFIRSFLKWNPSSAVQEQQKVQRRQGAAKTNHNKGLHRGSLDPECSLCAEEGVR